VSEVELNEAIKVLEKSKREKLRAQQKESFLNMHQYSQVV
jgi:hypothetical protein